MENKADPKQNVKFIFENDNQMKLPSEISHVPFGRGVHKADDGVALALVEDSTRVQFVDALRVVVVPMEVEHANLDFGGNN